MNLFNEIKADYEAQLVQTHTEEEREVVLEQLRTRLTLLNYHTNFTQRSY
jgi:hypothetical protein